MPEGPFGGPRPFTEYRLLIDLHEPSVDLFVVGPFGFLRPFAKKNPPVTQDRVDACVLSESGRRFGAGVLTQGQTRDINELPPEQRLEAMDLAERWCEGTLEATALEDLDPGQATALRQTVEQQLQDMVRTGEEFEVEALE